MADEEQIKSEEEEGDVQTKPKSVLELADEKISRMEELDKSLGEKLVALQEMKATDMLGGTSSAGQSAPGKKEMSDEEYAQRVMAGETPDVPKKE